LSPRLLENPEATPTPGGFRQTVEYGTARFTEAYTKPNEEIVSARKKGRIRHPVHCGGSSGIFLPPFPLSEDPDMYIIAIGWLYVTVLMAFTETSILAGVLTFLFYGLFPVALLLWLLGTPLRRKRRRALEAAEDAEAAAAKAEALAAVDVAATSVDEKREQLP
jgi:hypothetical protein